jgi:hypothetical protein
MGSSGFVARREQRSSTEMVINAVDVARQSRLGTGLNLEQRCGQIW